MTFFLMAVLSVWVGAAVADEEKAMTKINNPYKLATLAGGCFWCMQPPYDKLDGVMETKVGYMGGSDKDPTYEEVSTGTTGHAEAVQITYDPSKVSYEQILEVFWHNIDPTTLNQQFADVGSQYRTVIFYHDEEQKKIAGESKKKLAQSGKFNKPIVTAIEPASTFYPAEDYHQRYYRKNEGHYNMYKVGSGRAGFIKNKWGEAAPQKPPSK